MRELNIIPEMLARWLTKRDFRVKLHATRRYLRRSRELQLQLGAMRAAQVLAGSLQSEDADLRALRAACVDLIKLARDSRARRGADDRKPEKPDKSRSKVGRESRRNCDDGSKPTCESTSTSQSTSTSPLIHPELDESEANRLMSELDPTHVPTSEA
jgi:hypothetical protein